MPPLPNPLSLTVASGSQFNQVFVIKNSNGTLVDLTGKIFEFYIRTEQVQTSSTSPIAHVNSTSSTASGTIVVDLFTAAVSVTVSAPAMTLPQAPYYYTLWLDEGLTDATALVAGTMFVANVAAP